MMRWFDRLRRRLSAMLKRDEMEREMAEEMRFHLEMEATDLMRTRGLSGEEARRQAGISFGGVGIRRSLGASEAAVIRLVIWQGMMPVAIGLAIGLGAAFVSVRLVEAMLFGVEARDPVIFVSSAAFLTVVALLASWGPARRATRVDPMVALRTE